MKTVQEEISLSLNQGKTRYDEEMIHRNGNAFAGLEQGIFAALETYSNVHRGRGHFSVATTHLYEKAREIVLDYMGLEKRKNTLLFLTPLRASKLISQLKPGRFQKVSSAEIGLPFGVTAVAVKRNAIGKNIRSYSGGGTARLVSTRWVIPAEIPDRFEAGTPAIINVIAFAKALSMIGKYGIAIFRNHLPNELSVEDLFRDDLPETLEGGDLLLQLQQKWIGSESMVPTIEGNKPFINLDNSATTPTFIPVWDTFRKTLRSGENQKQEIIRTVKSVCAEMLGFSLPDYDIVFTSNTTEAINLVAESIRHEFPEPENTVILSSMLEHSSNDLPWLTVSANPVIRLSITPEGFFDLNEIENLLREYNLEGRFGSKRIRIVALSGASNVLGVYNNLEKISRIVHQSGSRLLIDAAQLVAHRRVNMEECYIDYLAFSGHKVYAPFGSGALIVRKGNLKFGKPDMELIRKSGEENIAGIAAMGKALMLLQRIGLENVAKEERKLTQTALKGMADIKGLRVFGIKNPESPAFKDKGGVIAFSMKGRITHRVAKDLAEHGAIGVRSGCHCAHVLIKRLLGLGPAVQEIQGIMVRLFPKLQLPGMVRVSFGIENTAEDVELLVQTLKNMTSKKAKESDKGSTNKRISDFVVSTEEKVFSS